MPAEAIYLDNNATTPIDPSVVEAMVRAWRECGANPASQHALGRLARRMLEEAREGILELLGAHTGGMESDQLVFTSGGTEANNLFVAGLLSAASPARPKTRQLIISPFEHHSIRVVAEALSRQRVELHVCPGIEELSRHLDRTGSIERTLLVSFMLASNETGTLFPVEEIVKRCEPYAAYVHTDAAQAVGKVRVHFRDLGVDALTIAPHKFHGPLGIGALALRHGIKLQPLLMGGFQQSGLRPGTENVALAVGFHQAVRLAVEGLAERAAQMQTLRDDFERRLCAELADVVVVGANAPRLPNTSCVAFAGLNRQALVMALDLAGVACSTGSACASGSSEPSPTLVAMGLSEALIQGAVRFSFGAYSTAAQMAEAANRIIKVVKHLRAKK